MNGKLRFRNFEAQKLTDRIIIGMMIETKAKPIEENHYEGKAFARQHQ